MKSMLHHSGYQMTLLYIVSFLTLCSCKKDKDKGTNVIEIPEIRTGGNVKLIPLDFSPGNQTVTVITLKNQATGSAGSAQVKLSLDTATVKAAGASLMPANSYTIPTLEYVVPANGSVDVPMVINRSKLTVDSVYGLGFKIATVNTGTIANDAKSIVVKFDLRNRWDGLYKVTGSFVDVAAPSITFKEFDADLVTTGPAQVTMLPKELGIPGYLILSGTSLSYYGSFGPVFNFDPATNKITSVVNSYGQPASNTRSAMLDATGSNVWSPATKNFAVKFWMLQPNTVTTPPHIRVYFTNTFDFQKVRF